MRLVPLKRYARPNLPTLAELAARRDSRASKIKKKSSKKAFVALLIASSALFAGCGNTPVSQDIQDYWDRALVALHLRPKSQRLMGVIALPRPQPPPQSQPMTLLGEVAAPMPEDNPTQQAAPEDE